MTEKGRHRRGAARLKSDGYRGPVRRFMVATGLLLSIAVLAASAQSWAVFSRKVTGQGRPQPKPSAMGTPEANQPAAGPVAHEADRQVADPVRLRIPAIGVDAPIDPLAVDNNRVLPPPNSNDRTGWWRDGPEPGERGPAVIVGHVDSHGGPAVFIRLTDLHSGDQILIDRADSTTAIFITQRIEQRAKDAFPTQAVYGDTRTRSFASSPAAGTSTTRTAATSTTSSSTPIDHTKRRLRLRRPSPDEVAAASVPLRELPAGGAWTAHDPAG